MTIDPLNNWFSINNKINLITGPCGAESFEQLSKTIEGLVGGIVLATGLGVMMSWLTPFNVWQATLIGAIVCIFGFFGGLVMSAIKRDRGVKDWGQLIHGHGGMLDRIDSICFSAPVLFHILRYWWT